MPIDPVTAAVVALSSPKISDLFSAAGHLKTILQLLGILDSLDAKIDRLLKSELDSALRLLEQAANSEREYLFLLRDARANFNKAISLERGFRLGTAHLGLAVTHHLLGDEVNCRNSLASVLKLNPIEEYGVVKAAAFEMWNKKRHAGLVVADHAASTVGLPMLGALGVPIIGWLVAAVAYTAGTRMAQAKIERETLKGYWEKVVKEALTRSPEAKSLAEIQNGVAGYLGLPLPWLDVPKDNA